MVRQTRTVVLRMAAKSIFQIKADCRLTTQIATMIRLHLSTLQEALLPNGEFSEDIGGEVV